MKLAAHAKRMRIYTGERDRIGTRPLFEVVVEEARRRGIAGATVFRGISGFGAHSRVHTNKILRLSEDLPIVVEIVDHQEKFDELFDFLNTHIKEGLITLEDTTVLLYRHRQDSGQHQE
ncbi:MAG: DUF190 domain-containing protein [Desulfovibrionales bacterium]